ncbi:unnamed protein product [Onchocerca ochengi]|uniref:Reelin domain-containing protein n=1 Tax=Onchocerca ochengi TaxID=42157 RepID=A0A182EA51_ONCOC|nr:unnamed protein product [Onchocerca ochengi]
MDPSEFPTYGEFGFSVPQEPCNKDIFSHSADKNMRAQTIIIRWVVPECKTILIALLLNIELVGAGQTKRGGPYRLAGRPHSTWPGPAST